MGETGDAAQPNTPEPTERPAAAHRASAEPVTERGRRTRASLIDAARQVFATRGYHDATVGDITATAAVAHGTFYTYFDSKRDLFIEVIDALVDEFRSEARSLPRTGDDPFSRIERGNRGYLRAYSRNAALMGALEQIAIADADLREIRMAARRFWVDRTERQIEKWQAEGVARRDLDARYAANSLGAMVDRCALLWFVLGEPYDEDKAVATLTNLYCGALGLRGPG